MNIATGSPDFNAEDFKCEFTPTAPAYVPVEKTTGKSMWGSCQSRARVELDASLVLKVYPFDRQNADVVIESVDYTSDQLVWEASADTTTSIIPPTGVTGIAGWVIKGTSVLSSTHEYTTFGESYNQLTISLTLQRNADYFVARYVWGVTFLVAMGLLVLLVPGNEPDRLGFVQSSFLGIVSWQFILVASTPNMGYSTRLDEFFIVAMAIIFVAFAWNSFRIGFFEWFESPPAPTQALSDLDAGKKPEDGDVADGSKGDALGTGQWTRSRAAVVPEQAPPKKRHALLDVLCCGDTTLHWRADTAVGVGLSLIFAIATASLFSQPAMDAAK